MLPARLLPDDIRLEPHHIQVTAANGSPIKVTGKKKFTVKLNNIPFDVVMLVSSDVDEAMNGMDFLHSHETMWLLNKGKLIIDR